MDLKEIGEFGLIDRIKRIVDPASADLVVGIGDAAAHIKTSTMGSSVSVIIEEGKLVLGRCRPFSFVNLTVPEPGVF